MRCGSFGRWWCRCGLGLLCDLGYASMKLLRACEQHNVRYVMRLKDSWKPKVLAVARGTLTDTFVPGTDLDILLDDEVLLLDGKVIDVDSALGPTRIPARLVGIKTPKGYCFFLINGSDSPTDCKSPVGPVLRAGRRARQARPRRSVCGAHLMGQQRCAAADRGLGRRAQVLGRVDAGELRALDQRVEERRDLGAAQ